MKQVYITRFGKFLPNEPVDSLQVEEMLGMVNNRPSRSKRVILRNNGIKSRYYALDKNGNITHTNAEMTSLAIQELFSHDFSPEDIELLCCGTSSPDQLMPSHAAMVHGLLGKRPIELASLSGVCCSGLQALKHGYLSILAGNTSNAVCTGSELSSPSLHSRYFNPNDISEEEIEKYPVLAFEKDFLRWMLSDGAGAALLEDKPRGPLSLRIEWIEAASFAHQLEACMYAGADKQTNGIVKGWREFSPEDWIKKDIFVIKQDVKLLDRFIVEIAADYLKKLLEKRNLEAEQVTWFLPHLSSEYFRNRISNAFETKGIQIPLEKWYTNLSEVGNIGSASIFLIMESLVNSGRLKKGDKILLGVPESSRFSYVYSLLTVV